MTSVDYRINAENEQPEVAPASTSPKPPRNLAVFSFIITLLFNHICGFFALYFTVSAKQNWKQKDFAKASRHAKYSTGLIALGTCLGLVTYAISLSLYFTIRHDNTGETNMNTYSTYCCRAPINEQAVGKQLVDLVKRNNFRILCEASDGKQVYADPHNEYRDCCFEFCEAGVLD